MGFDQRKTRQIVPRKAAIKANAKLKTAQVKAQTDQATNDVKENSRSNISSKAKSLDASRNLSILHYLNKCSLGERESSIPHLSDAKKRCVINQVSRFAFLKTLNYFKQRVTTIAWHPIHNHVAAAGSKGGELTWHNLKVKEVKLLPGIGPGGSIVGLKFHRDKPYHVYTASITGNVKELDFNNQAEKTFMTTDRHEDWFSSLDVCFDKKIILAGDTFGYAHLITTDGIKVWSSKKRFHKKKVTHLEFSPFDPHICVSASNDRCVKMWDLRMMSATVEPICVLPHERGVNSAYFSPSNRNSLLTTDQHSQIRVYKSPCWDEELIIHHPHRHFHHLTPMKATWHPMEDIVVVGRYPDDAFLKNDERTLDFYDGSNGALMHRLYSPTRCILSLIAFNISGDAIISGTGSTLVFWKDKDLLQEFK